MSDCVFCKIISGEIPCTKVFETDAVFAFRDINPQAPVHVLIVPKQHLSDLLDCAENACDAIAEITKAAAEIARIEEVDRSGFRLITNCGEDGRQSVNHLHFHLLGGKPLTVEMA